MCLLGRGGQHIGPMPEYVFTGEGGGQHIGPMLEGS